MALIPRQDVKLVRSYSALIMALAFNLTASYLNLAFTSSIVAVLENNDESALADIVPNFV